MLHSRHANVGCLTPTKDAALHLYHLKRSLVVAGVSGAGAVLQQKAPITQIVGLSHDGVHADVRRNAAQNEMRDAEILKDHKKIADERRAFARLVDNDLTGDGFNLLDNSPTRGAADQKSTQAALWLVTDAHGVLADDLAPQNLVVRTIAEVGNVSFAAMDDGDTRLTNVVESSGRIR